ncbi:hypothetical protein SZ30_29755 [Burkholderia pseudomallei]|nr:hypothetical protein SZ30_29755 [Burkholderia pseudomallei]
MRDARMICGRRARWNTEAGGGRAGIGAAARRCRRGAAKVRAPRSATSVSHGQSRAAPGPYADGSILIGSAAMRTPFRRQCAAETDRFDRGTR